MPAISDATDLDLMEQGLASLACIGDPVHKMCAMVRLTKDIPDAG